MSNDDDVGWLGGGSHQPGAGGRTRKVVIRDHIVAPGTGSVSTSTAAVEIALAAFGIETSDMKAYMEKEVDDADLQAIRERTLHPEDANVPKPDDFDDEKFIAVSASYAYSILDGRKQAKAEMSKGKDRRVSVLTTTMLVIASLFVGVFGGGQLQKYLDNRAEPEQTTEQDQ